MTTRLVTVNLNRQIIESDASAGSSRANPEKTFRLAREQAPIGRDHLAKLVRETEVDFGAIVKRLDAVLALLLDRPALAEGRKLPMMKRVELLNSVGLRNIEIAQIMGLKPTTIAVVLNTLRKRAKKEK
jgi:hypothetical protein